MNGSAWRGWQRGELHDGAVTSTRLGATAPVQNRMFPKVRSWFALGAPLELLSPLSVARIVYLLVFLVTPFAVIEAAPARGPLIVTVVVADAIVVAALLRVHEINARACHLLVVLATIQTAVVVWSVNGGDLSVPTVLLLVLAGAFAALFLTARAVIAHVLIGAVGVGVAVAAAHGGRDGLLVGAGVLVVALPVSLTLWLTTAAARRRSGVDPDTGLPNGFGLAEQLSARPRSSGLVVAAVVLRGLAEAREALGYQVGTELLRRAVEDLGQVLPASAAMARVDGDELVVAAPLDAAEAASAAATDLATQLIDGIGSGRYVVGEVEVSMRAHVGLAVAPWDGHDVTELIRRASLTARQAIASGRPHARWDGATGALTAADLTLLADLRLAPERGELWMAYQPQIVPATGRTASVEALLRWTSARHGTVPPGVFIPLAERTGLIDRLTEWVLDEALDAQVRWSAAGMWLPVSVNISPLSLADPHLSDRILGALRARDLPAALLNVEVTETAAVDVVQAVDRLRPLHDSGVRVSIDDFGTGYTSLSVLPHLPVDELKVDQRFVMASLTSAEDDAIVHSVRELAHRLGLEAVAEGVETAELAEHMTLAGFDLLQGYHFARPLDGADLLAYVRAGVVADVS